VRVGFPQESCNLVVTDVDPSEQTLHSAGLVRDVERLKEPVADLVGVAKAPGADFGFELFDLVRGKLAGVALVEKGAQGVAPLVAKAGGPFTQWAEADPQQSSGFFPAVALGAGQDGGEALVHTPVKGRLASSLDLPPLPGGQDNRFHGRAR